MRVENTCLHPRIREEAESTRKVSPDACAVTSGKVPSRQKRVTEAAGDESRKPESKELR